MTRLMMILYSMVSTTLMGMGVIVALTMGMVSVKAIVVAAVLGALLALPVSWLVAREIAG